MTKRKAGHRAADPGVHELAAALPRGRRTHAAVLLAFAILFSVLEVVSYRRESATWDEPVHVMDGYLSLTARDFRADLPRLDVPMLVIHGDDDQVLPYAKTAARLPGLISNVQMAVINGGPHAIPWTHSDQVNSALLGFLGHPAA